MVVRNIDPPELPTQYALQDGDSEETRRMKLKVQDVANTLAYQYSAKTHANPGTNIAKGPSPLGS